MDHVHETSSCSAHALDYRKEANVLDYLLCSLSPNIISYIRRFVYIFIVLTMYSHSVHELANPAWLPSQLKCDGYTYKHAKFNAT